MQTRVVEDFNWGWKFCKGQDAGVDCPEPEAPAWHPVRLPHDWSIGEVLSNDVEAEAEELPGGIGWYAKEFVLSASAKSKRTRVEFDGVYNNATVWINGVSLGFHPYGYTAFSYDLTPHLRYGADANRIRVRVDRSAYQDCRWYSGSGIYRDVRLVTTDALCIEPWGTVVTTPKIADEDCQVVVRTGVGNHGAEPRRFVLEVRLFDGEGAEVAAAASEDALEAGGQVTVELSHRIARPRLWDTDAPHLYLARCTISDENGPVDQTETHFGVRHIRFDAATGFYLNGKPTLIKGVCLHHDGGGVGAAVPDGVWARRLRLLKEAGCNAIRTAHNPPSEAFLELCDRMGFLVQDEAFDEFDHAKDKRKNYKEEVAEAVTQGYTRYFAHWGEADIKSMVRRDRNHPSVIMWSLGNEVEWTYANYGAATGYWDQTNEASYYWTLPPYDTERLKANFAALDHEGPVLAETAARLAKWVREEDATRPVTANLVLPSIGHFSGYADALDLVGYSYRTVLYDYGREHYPEKPIYGAENWCKWSEWKPVLEKAFIPGIFLWTGVCYLGETSTAGRRGSGSGLLDFAGFDTASYHHFKTFWCDAPHVFATTIGLADSEYRIDADGEVVDRGEGAWKRRTWGWQPYNLHWNYRPGEAVVVEVFSNCPEVELFVGGRSLGSRRLEAFEDRIYKWHLPFEVGCLRAVGRGAGGEAAYEINTAAEPAGINLVADREAMAADGYDVVHLTAQLVDGSGQPVRHCEREIRFDVEGDCRVLATDNGANRSRRDYTTAECVTNNGRCLLILQANETAGEIAVKAVGEGEIASEPVVVGVGRA